ncbi:cytoplasmic dynein 1 intermediate chain-like isoform 2-T2 [Cochliomyia hominivorax]
MENNLNPCKNPSKYDDLIKLRKAKLEKMRKERQILINEKIQRDTKDNLDEILLKNQITGKVKQINDKEIDKIENEIRKLSENLNGNQKQELKPETSDKSLSKNKTLNLQFSSLQITEFPPIVKPKYSKHTQTEHSRLYKRNDTSLNRNYDEDDSEYQDEVSPLKLKYTFSSILPPGLLSPGLPNITDIEPALTPTNNKCPWNYIKDTNNHTLANNCENMLDSEDFHKSLKRVSLTMEKILSRNKNICVDYINGLNGDMYLDNNALLKLNHIFHNENLTQNRCITSIDWSPHCAGQIATSYYKNLDSPSSPEDVILWNQNFNPQTPEHVFHSHSSVMSLSFTKFNENLIIGATYSGQIVLWDKRVNSSIALRSTKMNYKAHTQPIHCLRVIDDNSSHNLISISSDGKLCLWNLDMLAVPLDVMQLELKISETIKKPIGVTCMDFPANGVNNLVFGSEDGCAYTV